MTAGPELRLPQLGGGLPQELAAQLDELLAVYPSANPAEQARIRELIQAVAGDYASTAYASDPVGWVQDVLEEFLWSKQREILESLVHHRRVAVPACHDSGKSFVASRAMAWWISAHPPGEAFVVSSAPTFSQVRAILWRELGKAHTKGALPGRITQTEWWLGRELVGFGRKPADAAQDSGITTSTAFQGIHARYVLVLLDEADGIPEELWTASDALITNEDSRILAIGNPDNPTSTFARMCEPGSGFHVLHIDGLATPNLSGEFVPDAVRKVLLSRVWVDEAAQRWGEEDPRYVSKVRGRFPEDPADTRIIPAAFIRRCMIKRTYDTVLADAELSNRLQATPDVLDGTSGGSTFAGGEPQQLVAPNLHHGRRGNPPGHSGNGWHGPAHQAALDARLLPVELGVDVGGGGDETVIRERRGMRLGRTWRSRNVDAMADVAMVLRAINETGATAVKVDSIGVGHAFAARLEELQREGKHPAKVVRVNVGERASQPMRFGQLRDEMWWRFRELCEDGALDLNGLDDETIRQLRAPDYIEGSDGRIRVEPKDKIKPKIGRSPDDAEALLLAFVTVPRKSKQLMAW